MYIYMFFSFSVLDKFSALPYDTIVSAIEISNESSCMMAV